MAQTTNITGTVNTDSLDLSERREQWFTKIKQGSDSTAKVNTDFMKSGDIKTVKTSLNFAASLGLINDQEKNYITNSLLQTYNIKEENEQEYNDFIESLNDSDIEEYEKYNRYMNGTYTDQDKSSLAKFSISGTRKVQSSVMDQFNIFFKDGNNVSDTRTIELGKKTFDIIKKNVF